MSEEKPASDRVVPLTSFMNYGEAHLARVALELAGIDCMLADENSLTMYPLYAQAVGGIKLMVRESDLEAAWRVLEDAAPEAPAEVPPEERRDLESDSPACPECESNFVEREGMPFWLALAALVMVGIPFMFMKPRWRCSACGHQWTGR